ncbi:MAG: NUDIX hydrolase [Candidatus Caldatribacteriaceae bacterium]
MIRKVCASGGVILRKRGGNLEVLLVQKKDSKIWTLPKGHLEKGETELQAALREVQEETGYRVVAHEKIGEIRFTYWRNGQELEETVSFFLMEPQEEGEKTEIHEIERIAWFPLLEALAVMRYDNEKRMVTQGGEIAQKCWEEEEFF